MWSPESRKTRAQELKLLHDRMLRYRQLADRFAGYFPGESDNARLLATIRNKLEDLQSRVADRHRRLVKGVVKIGVVGLEKQGKSAFLSAWLKSEKLLPSEAERCTWSTTVVEPGDEGQFGATVVYYSKQEFQNRIASYFDALEPGSSVRWEGLNEAELLRLKAAYRAREGHEVDDADRASKRELAAMTELRDIASSLAEIKSRLGKQDDTIRANSLDDLADGIRPFIALKDTRNGNKPFPAVRAVKLVTVKVPVTGAMPGVVLMDLPGIDAPSDKARRDTQEALTDEVDLTIFVKDVTRPSLVQQEIELLRTMQTADRSISVKDRVFVVLTKVDLFEKPDENGNWHWALAARNFKEQGIDRVFPYSKIWAHNGVDTTHPVAGQVQDYYGETRPVTGLEKLQLSVANYLQTDLEQLDERTTRTMTTEFNELETQLKGALISVKDSLNPNEFERRKEHVFDELWEHIIAGEAPVGLLPAVRSRLSAFMDFELSETQRGARAQRASTRIAEIRGDLLSKLTPAEAEAKRRQMPSPGIMNETAVEIEMRNLMRERCAARVAGLGEDFRDSARESIENMMQEMFTHATHEGGRLELLLNPGRTLLERIDTLGKSGHVSESVLRYQNREIARADVAFEVLSRYFARQIIDILDATDAGDREIRETEMRGLEQFFGMHIADKAAGAVTGSTGLPLPGQTPAKTEAAATKGFPSPTPAGFPTAPAAFTSVRGEAQGPGGAVYRAAGAPASAHATPEKSAGTPPQIPSVGTRDWTKMLDRVKGDVNRICDFLEALAKHPRGLQKYHEEVVRTVHDSWLDREGEQSLRRWVRSECVRIWPSRFAAIDAEEKRARDDIRALEDLFGA